ncbi:MAG: hypothetical protein ABI846_07445 [Rudaea sp.]
MQALAVIDLFHAKEQWAQLRRPGAVDAAQSRLIAVAAALGDREYLVSEFSGADLLMATVLRLLRHTTIVSDIPVLAAYQARCEARPAFQRALADQLATFERYAPLAA